MADFDSDGDGFTDSAEFAFGTDPCNADQPTIMPGASAWFLSVTLALVGVWVARLKRRRYRL